MTYRLLLYPLARLLAAILFRVFGPVRLEGRERVPRRGGLLVCANHISDCDPPLVGYAVPRPCWFMAKSEIFGIRVIGRIARWLRAFPVRRGTPDRKALRRAEELLMQGECVVVFPEGLCSETGRMRPLLPGAALILRKARVPCICAGVVGSNRIVPYGAVRPYRARGEVRVRFGEPHDFSDLTGRDAIERITRALTEDLARLIGQDPPDALEEGGGGPPVDEGEYLDPPS